MPDSVIAQHYGAIMWETGEPVGTRVKPPQSEPPQSELPPSVPLQSEPSQYLLEGGFGPFSSRVYLKVPFREKDEAIALGA
eukprot:4506849-Alexandrium_andersonii.AAC.1